MSFKKVLSVVFIILFSSIYLYGATQTISLNSDWNLIGSNIDNVDISQFPADKIYTIWNWSENTWQVYSPSNQIKQIIQQYGIETFQIFQSGKGYWINVKKNIENFQIDLSGDSPENSIINLTGSGWFLAGLKATNISTIDVSKIFNGKPINSLWTWKNNKWYIWSENPNITSLIQQYQIDTFSSFNSNDGFWINYLDNLTLDFAQSSEGENNSNVYGSFVFPPAKDISTSSDTDNITLEFPPSPVLGKIEGIQDDTHEVVFASDNGTTFSAPVKEDGTFELELPPMPFTISLLNEGRFETAAFSEPKEDPGTYEEDNKSMVNLKYENGKLVLDSGNFVTKGEALASENGIPVGLSNDNKFFGLTEKANTLTEKITSIDADKDGIPDMFDIDADGDGIIDSVDDNVLALIPPPMPGLPLGKIVPGARAFTNLKLDPNGNPPDKALKFMFNDELVVTLEFKIDSSNTMLGYVIDNVTIQRLPNWSSYGYPTTVSDWSALETPSFNGQLSKIDNETWSTWLKAPQDDGTLSAKYPDYVKNGGRIPLTFDFNDNRTKPDVYRLKITYRSLLDNSTITKYSIASTVYSYRTPPLVETITTDNGTCNYDISDLNGCGHITNPVVYPGSGDVIIKGLPPKLDKDGTIMWGKANWKPTIFYYNSSGNQIGGINVEPIMLTTSPTNHAELTVDEKYLTCSSPSSADVDGDGNNDLQSGYTCSDIAWYKIDFTIETLTPNGGNAALFIYLTK